MTNYILSGLLLVIYFSGCADTTADRKREVEAVEKVIDNSIGWAKTKNLDILYNSLAGDSGLFIYHPDSKSTVRCLNDMRQLEKFWMNPEFQATRYDIRDLRISFSPSGDAAWFSAVLDDSATFKGRPIGWKDARWTGVLEKIDDQWKIAQMHFSFASD